MQTHPADFLTLHDSFRPKILGYLGRMVGPGEADDLTQIVMLKVYEALPRFRGESAPATWIYRIATNVAMDALRRRRARAGVEVAGDASDPGEDLGSSAQEPSVESVSIRREMNECIREYIGGLPESYRTVVVLSDIEGFDNPQIADILGLSLATVKIRLHRGRERLRQDLARGCSFYRDDERNEPACDRKPAP